MDIPTDDASIHKRYLTSKNSIIKNIPKPKMMVVDKHSYVSIKECLSNYLILNRMPTSITTLHMEDRMIECITQSNVAKQIYKRGLKVNNKVPQDGLLFFLAIQWSDDFEPNTSVQSNRGSVWIKTLSLNGHVLM